MASRVLQQVAPRAVIHCWGDFAIEDRATGADLRPRGRKARALLAYLSLHPGKAISRERLTGLLWGDRAEEQARGSLRQTLFELRPLSRGEQVPLKVDREAITLEADAFETDLDRWRRLVADSRFEELLAELPDAHDTLFANLDGVDTGFDEWLQLERTRQREALIGLVADASAAAVTAGQTRAARALHTRLVELNPEDHPAAPQAPAAPLSMPPAAAAPKPRSRATSAAVALGIVAAVGTIGSVAWLRFERPAAPDVKSEARELTDTAASIIYQRRGDQFPVATNLLRRALLIEPDYVPALANLAAVTAMGSPTEEQASEAERLARRAIQLDPKSGFSWGVLGMVLGFHTPEARAAIKRAAVLDSRDPQIQFWLSNVLGDQGDFPGRLQALRRAAAADPLWQRASGMAALAAWEMGYSDEANALAAHLRDIDFARSFDCAYAIDWARGDYAGLVRDTLAARPQLTAANNADWKLGMGLLVLGHVKEAQLLLKLPPPLWRIASDAGLKPGELEPLLIQATRDGLAYSFELTALRQVLRDGRAAEIVSAYDRQVGTLAALRSGKASNSDSVLEGLQVALALRAVGRRQEADALLARADAAIRESQSHGAMPNWMYAAASGVWAAQGRQDLALNALATAIDRGWHYSPMTPLPDMEDIPSFAGLRGDPRFEALRHRLLDHNEAERRKLGPVPI
jgi:DNA-binding SARP family transcriptional activator